MGTSASTFLPPAAQEEIKNAIRGAELNTSGEVRVHLENHCNGEVLDRAAYLFGKLGMKDTDLRNGVLIYLAVKDKKFAIIGDKGINTVVPENFWDQIKNRMADHFRNGRFTEGLKEAITSSGEHLKKHFPRSAQDVNELSDDISFGKD